MTYKATLQVGLHFQLLYDHDICHFPAKGTDIDPCRAGCPLLLALPPLAHCNASVSYRCHWTPLPETGLIGYARHLGSLEPVEAVRFTFSRLLSFAHWLQISVMCQSLTGRKKVTGTTEWRWTASNWTQECYTYMCAVAVAYTFQAIKTICIGIFIFYVY